MNLIDIKKRLESLGCTITKDSAFSIAAKCGDVVVVKQPESRTRVLVPSEGVDKISGVIPTPSMIKPRDVTIGKFNKQGPLSRIFKLDNLDEVEFTFGEEELKNSPVKGIRESMERLERANKFAYINKHDGIDPFKTVQKEIDFISNYLVERIEASIAKGTNNNVICGSKNLLHKSWTKADNDRYWYLVKVSCKVPALAQPVNDKLGKIGEWNTFSESDRFYVTSVMPSSFKHAFVTGIKVSSEHGKDHVEFELRDNKDIKRRDFLAKMAAMQKDAPVTSKSDDEPVNPEDIARVMKEPEFPGTSTKSSTR